MTAPNLDAIAALLDKATPGPWRVRETTESQYQPRVLQAKYVMAALEDYDRSRTDAAVIVAAVNALPALLAYVRELESLVERMARSDSNVAIAMRERCAQACEEAAQTRLSEGHDAPTMAAVCAAAIRQCAEGLR